MARSKFGSYVPPPRPTPAQKAADQRLQGVGARHPNRDAIQKALMFDPPQVGGQDLEDALTVDDPVDGLE